MDQLVDWEGAEKTTAFNVCDKEFVGLVVGEDCVVEVTAYGW